MYCEFCGRNFESTEGFEEISRYGRHLIRCEPCREERREEVYDWGTELTRWGGRGSKNRKYGF